MSKPQQKGQGQPSGHYSNKLAPQNREAEESVIASLILAADEYMADVVQFLKPEHFHQETNGWCYEAMVHLYDRNIPIDEITVNQELEQMEKLNDVGGLGYLSLLVSRLSSDLHCLHWAHIVHNLAILRHLLKISGMIAAKAYEGKVNSIEETVQVCHDIFSEIWNDVGETPFVISEVVKTTSDPPQYAMRVNGVLVKVTADDLIDFKRFRKIVMIYCNFIPLREKDEEWTLRVNRLLKGVKEITAPPEISLDHSYWQAAMDVIHSMPFVDTMDEFDSGYPILRGQHVYLQGSAFIGLWQQKIKQTQGVVPNVSLLWGILNSQGGHKSQVRFGEKFKRAWQLPVDLTLRKDSDVVDDGDTTDLLF